MGGFWKDSGAGWRSLGEVFKLSVIESGMKVSGSGLAWVGRWPLSGTQVSNMFDFGLRVGG